VSERTWSLEEIRDRFAIEDLYDRQLAAAEAHDWARYDTTFDPDARVDLRDFGEPERAYPAYREWLVRLSTDMPRAMRLTGGLRLELAGRRATTRVPVICLVEMRAEAGLAWTQTALFYNDELARTDVGWRIMRRYEELVYPDGSEFGPGFA
jgi:hypothetical protein